MRTRNIRDGCWGRSPMLTSRGRSNRFLHHRTTPMNGIRLREVVAGIRTPRATPHGARDLSGDCGRIGAAGRVRTPDPLLTKQLLYQLSYGGNAIRDRDARFPLSLPRMRPGAVAYTPAVSYLLHPVASPMGADPPTIAAASGDDVRALRKIPSHAICGNVLIADLALCRPVVVARRKWPIALDPRFDIGKLRRLIRIADAKHARSLAARPAWIWVAAGGVTTAIARQNGAMLIMNRQGIPILRTYCRRCAQASLELYA